MSGVATTGDGISAPSVCTNSTPTNLSEILLETAIEVAKQRLCEAPTRAEKMDAWREMCRLIDQRSPSRVRFVERMRGLR